MAEGAPPTEQIVEEVGGYENHFVETVPDRLICLVCQYPSRDPHLSVCCGHVFCKSCLDSAKKVKYVDQVCPYCRSKEFQTVRNKQADREIKSFHVFCSNTQKGCEWKGELNDLTNHLKTRCSFQPIQCPNKCGKISERKYMANHVEAECPRRMVRCQYCGITGEYWSITTEHVEKCPKVLLACPNKCTIRGVPREDMEAHKKACPLEMVQCEYHSIGCEEWMRRKDLIVHIQHCMDKHLRLTFQHVSEQQKCINKQQERIDSLEATVEENKKELFAAKNELYRSENERSATNKDLVATQTELNNTRILAIDLNTKLTTQEQHLNMLQGKLQDNIKKLEAYGEALKQKVDGNIEAELKTVKQELITARKELATVKDDLKIQTQTEIKDIKTYVDRQCQSIKTDVDKELSANKQKLAVLMQQFAVTKNELVELSKMTKSSDAVEQHLKNLDTLLQAEVRDVKMLTAEQQQTKNDLVTARHDVESLLERVRKMSNQFNIEDLQIGFQRQIDALSSRVQQNYAPRSSVREIEQQLDIAPGGINSFRWTRELHSTSITGEEICPVTIKVSKFENKKKNEVKWCSDGFYTQNRGYKMCLRVIAGGAGSGKGSHLSVFLYLMKGQYDTQLDWPLKGEFEMMLLNQLADFDHHSNTVKFSEKTPTAISNKVKSVEMAADGLGRNEFILMDELRKITNTCQYLKDDCIFIRVCKL